MGWSARADAIRTLEKWDDICWKQTGSSNAYITPAGEERFYETTTRLEHDDGAITGTVYAVNKTTGYAHRVGSFRIEGNGKVTRKPAGLQER